MGHSRTPTQNTAGDGFPADPIDGTARVTIRRAGDGGTAYGWLSGPDKGYGFGSSGPPNRSVEEHRESIRVFLAMIDPNTGYIGDD